MSVLLRNRLHSTSLNVLTLSHHRKARKWLPSEASGADLVPGRANIDRFRLLFTTFMENRHLRVHLSTAHASCGQPNSLGSPKSRVSQHATRRHSLVVRVGIFERQQHPPFHLSCYIDCEAASLRCIARALKAVTVRVIVRSCPGLLVHLTAPESGTLLLVHALRSRMNEPKRNRVRFFATLARRNHQRPKFSWRG